MSGSDEDTRLLSVAESISEGKPVDWPEVEEHTGPLDLPILSELKALEGLARSHEETPKQWGPFTIIGEIARGAFGTVYIATDPALGLTVALKVIRPRNPEAAIDPAKAFNEARLLAKITHPNVVRVFRVERIGYEVGLVMELVKGRTLDDLVLTESLFGPNEAALIGLDLCRALAAVHATGALHGDIKAHNVMRGEGGRTVLMDFGAAKDLTLARTHTGQDFVGTPLYMAPEVFDGQPRSKSTDLYSLGVLLYYLVSGRYPVSGESRTEVQRRHGESGEFRPLRDVRPDLPDSFIRVVERALARSPEGRYQSAGEFEAALANTLPVRAPLSNRKPPIPWKPLAAAAVLLVLGVAAARYWPYSPGSRARTESFAPSAVSSAPAAAADDAGSYRISAALNREKSVGGESVTIGAGTRLALSDMLSLDVNVSEPVYLYVVNEDEHGESYLLFPLPGLTPTNPLPVGRHRLPGTLEGAKASWVVTSTGGGKEHFLLIASRGPSPAFEKMFATLPRPTLNKPVVRLSRDNLGVLRSVGGLALSNPDSSLQLHTTPGFAAELPASEEIARGVWVRQVSVDNPD